MVCGGMFVVVFGVGEVVGVDDIGDVVGVDVVVVGGGVEVEVEVEVDVVGAVGVIVVDKFAAAGVFPFPVMAAAVVCAIGGLVSILAI